MRLLLFSGVVGMFTWFGGSAMAQEAWQEARTFSAIEPAAPRELVNSGVNCSRVPISGSALNISTESNYLLPVAPDRAVVMLLRVEGNPAETDTLVAKPAASADFSRLHVSDSSLKTLKGLNLAATEKPPLDTAFKSGAADRIDGAWRDLLLRRTTAFQDGGLLKAGSYESGGAQFQPARELVGLLRQRPPVLKRFVNIMDEIMTGNSAAGRPPVHYWANEKIQGSQNLSLGSVHARQTAAGWQAAGLTYYSASSYFLSVTLYEFWPVEIGGRTQTYVWRGDYVISPSLGYTKGIERMAAENIMTLEVKSDIRSQIQRCVRAD
jgi:hypothetical protein